MAKNPKRVAAGKKAKRKGSSNELKLAKQFKAWWGKGEWARTPASGGWSTKDNREGFRAVGDIMTTAVDFRYCIEAKKQEGWTLQQLLNNEKCIILDWWKQAVEETPSFDMWTMLVFARNYVKPIVGLEYYEMDTDLKYNIRDRAFPTFTYQCSGFSPIFMISLENLFKLDPKLFGKDEEEQ